MSEYMPLPTWPRGKYTAVIDMGTPITQQMLDRIGYEADLIHWKDDVLPKGTYLLAVDMVVDGLYLLEMVKIIDRKYREQYGFASDIDLYTPFGMFHAGTEELFKHFTTIYSGTTFVDREDLLAMDVIPV